VEIRTYRSEDAPAALALLRTAFRDWPGPRVLAADRPADFFRWKHETNPQGSSFIVLAEEDGRLLAMRAYMPWSLTAGGIPTGAVQAVDLATHPDARGRGLNTQLQRHAMAELRPSTAFSIGAPNDMSKSQSRKAGWRPVGRLPVWVRLQRPLSVARGARSIRGHSDGAPPAVEAPTAESVLANADWAAELPRRARAGRFSAVSDLAYLRWRYQPFLADYRAIAHENTGLAIFRLRRRGRLNEATVCELLADDRKTAARLLRAVAKSAPFDYLSTAVPLRRAGLMRSPMGGPLLGMTPYREHVHPDPGQRSSWALTMGDLERLELS
jgi:GNAT superfamily N-acetyltransferase